MKFVISSLLIATFFHTANSSIAKSLFYELSAAVFNDELDLFLEHIKPTLKAGNESLGVPCFKPYQQEFYNISSTDNSTSVEGDISHVFIDGLSDYIVNDAKFRYSHLQVNLNLTWPNITLNSSYRINAVINKWGYFPIYGNGDVKLTATNFTVSSTMQMGLTVGRIFVRDMTITFHLGDVNLAATGIYDNPGVSHLTNAIVSSQLPFFVEHFQAVINGRVTPPLMALINRQLEELTFEDYLNIIG